MREFELEVFNKRIKNNIQLLERLAEFLGTYISSGRAFSSAEWNLSVIDELNESSTLIHKYNEINLEELPRVKEIELGNLKDILNWKIDAVVMKIKSVLRELREAKDYLDIYLKPNLSEKEKIKIGSLHSELDQLEKKDCEILVLQNLKEALYEVESNHYLAGAIISARVIDYIIHFIKEKEKLRDENLNQEIIKKFKEAGLIDCKDEEAGEIKKFFLDASKSSRDAISHKIEYLPNASECFSLLSYAFRMSDLLIKYIEKKNETKTN